LTEVSSKFFSSVLFTSQKTDIRQHTNNSSTALITAEDDVAGDDEDVEAGDDVTGDDEDVEAGDDVVSQTDG